MVYQQLFGHEGHAFHLKIKQNDLFQKAFMIIDKIPKKQEFVRLLLESFVTRLLNGGGSYVTPWFRPPQGRQRLFTINKRLFDEKRVGFMSKERREMEEQFQFLICKPKGMCCRNLCHQRFMKVVIPNYFSLVSTLSYHLSYLQILKIKSYLWLMDS